MKKGRRFDAAVADYLRPETSDWISTHAVAFWQSLGDTKKQEFLTVPVSELAAFSCDFLKIPWLTDFLRDAVLYSKLHNTWKAYVCPKPGCLRFFEEDQSLISHLMREHITNICGSNAWPLPHQDPSEQTLCAQALRRMVWKPIDIAGALNLLSTMCLYEHRATMDDVLACSDRLCSLSWPFSDDPTRIKLLATLGQEFQFLLAEQEQTGFSLLSDGHFSMLTALASKHVLIHIPPGDNMFFLGNLLAHSPLSFCFLDESSLALFVDLVTKIRHLVLQAAEPSLHQESSAGEVGLHGDEILDATSFSPDHNLFVLDHAKATNLCRDKGGLPSWLSNLPCRPSIAQVPTRAVQIFCQIETKLQLFVDRLHNFNMQLPSFIDHVKSSGVICGSGHCRGCQLKYEMLQFLPKVLHPEHSLVQVNLLKDKPSNHPLCSPCHFTISLKQQIAFCSEIESHYLGLVLLACELQGLEQQVRRVCAFDFQESIFWPLMKSLLRMRLYLNLKVRYLKLSSDGEKTLVAKCKRESAQVEHFDEKTNGDGCNEDTEFKDISIKEEYLASESGEVNSNSDTFSESKTKSLPDIECKGESQPEDKPWMVNSILRGLDSTFRDTVWAKKETVLFFCLEVSDILRRKFPDDEHNRLWEGVSWFRLNKTWKYWHCYCCDRKFPDQESHAIHMEFEHLIHISRDEYWLIPAPLRQDAVQSDQYQLLRSQSHDEHLLVPGPIKQDDPQGDIGLEDSITMDNSYTYFLVDALKFFQVPSTKEDDESVRDKQIAFSETLQDLQNLFTRLRRLFYVKRCLLRNLEGLCAFRCTLEGCHPLGYSRTLHDELLSSEVPTETTHMRKFLDLDFVVRPDGIISNHLIQEVCRKEHELLCELDDRDREILQILAEGSNLKSLLYDLCACDYRTEILPIAKSLIHARIALHGNIQSFVSTTIKGYQGLLSSIGSLYMMKPESFNLVPESVGKVFINITEKETGIGFAYLGINLRFDGETFKFGSAKMGGNYLFAGLSRWGNDLYAGYCFRSYGKVSFDGDGGTGCKKDDDGITSDMRELRERLVERALCSSVRDKLIVFRKNFEEVYVRNLSNK